MPESIAGTFELPTSLATMPESEISEINKQMLYEETYGKPVCFILTKKHSQKLQRIIRMV